MTVQNRISVSFNDEQYIVLERLSAHTHKPKAELIRMMVGEFLRENPDRFRRKTPTGLKRKTNIVLPDKPND